MEKLVKLLNEFEKSIWFKPDWKVEGNGVALRQSYYGTMISEMVVINKKNWFIQWLVDNDKIDYKKLVEDNTWNILKENWWTNDIALLMLLAIQDEPIEFLISILK